MERKRIAHETQAQPAGFQDNVSIIIQRACNAHNIIATIAIEPENADANATGKWCLAMRADVTIGVLTISDANIEAETFNPSIIAIGTWAATNQTPFNKELRLKTSRNCVGGQVLDLIVRNDGVSAGSVRHRLMLFLQEKTM